MGRRRRNRRRKDKGTTKPAPDQAKGQRAEYVEQLGAITVLPRSDYNSVRDFALARMSHYTDVPVAEITDSKVMNFQLFDVVAMEACLAYEIELRAANAGGYSVGEFIGLLESKVAAHDARHQASG